MIELNRQNLGTDYRSPELTAEYVAAESGFCKSGVNDTGEAFGIGNKYDGWDYPQN